MSCDVCEKYFDKKEALVNHITKVHTKVVISESPQTSRSSEVIQNYDTWNCYFCGKTGFNTEQRDKHICPKHIYLSVAQQKKLQKRKYEECIWGPYCDFNKSGKCWFSHTSSLTPASWVWGKQSNNDNYKETINSYQIPQNKMLWCTFQDRCTRKESCQYKHIEDVSGTKDEGFLIDLIQRKAQELIVEGLQDY
jgi:hypothetical protein